MLVTQAHDSAPIEDLAVDDEASVERKLERAATVFANRSDWLPAYKRIAILRRLAKLLERDDDAFALMIAREGGKPLTDARIETTRAVNGVESAIGELEHLAGREIPMGLTEASQPEYRPHVQDRPACG